MTQDWQRAQRAEIDCWLANQKKITTDTYQRAKRALWQRIFDKLAGFVDESELSTKSILEFGSGPTGVFMLVRQNPNFVCLDPLMDGYLGSFETMKESEVVYINSKLESFRTERNFDIILGFNAIDHVDNIKQALSQLRGLCQPDTRVVLSVNAHRLPKIQRLLSWTYPIFDKLHKHQYTSPQYRALFEKAGFRVVQEVNLDPELFEFEQALQGVQNHHYSIKRLISPAFWFFRILEAFGYPRHLYQNLGGGRALYGAQCYLLTSRDEK